MAPTVLGALRQFLPDFLKAAPPLFSAQRRALWAITHCRTPALGGRVFDCQDCDQVRFAWHSCNHKACPQCGAAATRVWVQRELAKLVQAPYFLVTFTLPSQLRECFFGPHAKEAFDLFFTAVSRALSEKLATDKGLRATVNGFTAVLHTWNQQLGFHPHIHCLVPGAGLNERGRLVCVRRPDRLVHLAHLRCAFRQHLRDLFKAVARTAINDARIQLLTPQSVTFRWKNRPAGGRQETSTVPGVEFVQRYLRHVLPQGLRSIRYYGFCHPAAKANRLRVQLHTGRRLQFGATTAVTLPPTLVPQCPCCHQPMRLVSTFLSPYPRRGPPRVSAPSSISLSA